MITSSFELYQHASIINQLKPTFQIENEETIVVFVYLIMRASKERKSKTNSNHSASIIFEQDQFGKEIIRILVNLQIEKSLIHWFSYKQNIFMVEKTTRKMF